jgi:predicted ATPase
MITELAVRFADAPGFVDSSWLVLSPGVSVLTGRNNVGKSRLLMRVRDLLDAVSNAQISAAIPLVRVTEGNIELTADLRGMPPPGLWEVRQSGHVITKSAWAQVQNGNWQLTYESQQGQQQNLFSSSGLPSGVSGVGGALPEFQRLNDEVNRIIYLPPQRIIQATVAPQPVDVPSTVGSDLGQAIYKHRNAVTAEFAEFEAAVTAVLPEVSMVLTDPGPGQQVTIKLRDRFAGFDVPIDQAGTGVNQLLHLMATVLFMPHGRLLLIDEPQLHLHPGAEKALASFLREHPEHDYVMATHSPLFINALAPDRAWLLTRDHHGTRIQSVFGEQLPRAHVLQELGLTPGDIVVGERLLLVEGSADVEVLPVLMRRLGWDPIRLNCVVLQLQGGDAARPLRDVIRELREVLNLPMMILLDGDKFQEIAASEVVSFVPALDLETILMRDSDAVRQAFDEVLGSEPPEGFDTDAWRTAWSSERIASFIAERKGQQPERKGASILADLAWAMGELTYRKAVHGPRIAALVRPEHLADLEQVLRPLLGEAIPAAE